MKKEIGSEFYYSVENIVKYIENQDKNNFFSTIDIERENCILLDSGRSCIKYLLKNILGKKINKILLPSFLCSSIVNAIELIGIDFEFYNVNSDLIIDIEDLDRKVKTVNEALYFINYFGFYQPNYVYEYLKKIQKTNLIIEDCTHTLFSKEEDKHNRYIGDFQIASIRKWFGIPDGAILFSKSSKISYDTNLTKSGNNDFFAMKFLGQLLKSNYIEDGKCKKEYFMKIMRDAVLTDEINSMSSISEIILNGYDYIDLKNKRKLNYEYLYNELNNNAIIEPIFSCTKGEIYPLGFPIKVKTNRDKFRQYLANNNIYCPVHWNSYKHVNGEYIDSDKLSNMILTIPCDQRYSQEDMKYIVDTINLYNEDN